MNTEQKTKIFVNAFVATFSLLFLYFIIVIAISGFKFASSQFISYWYFLVSLAIGFGVQIGLYSYLKQLVKNSSMNMGRKTMAITGTTSTLAMVSCCAHYLINIVPVLGITGVLSIIAGYQIQIFWIGLFFNLFGILFIVSRVIKFKKHHE